MDTAEDDEGRMWAELTTAEFFKAYVESNAIYDEYFSRVQHYSQKPNTEQLRSDDECR